MPLCPKTLELATAAGVENDVLVWLEASKCYSYKEVALLTTEEKDVRADVVEPMRAADPAVASEKTVIGVVQIKKLWIACRGLVAADTAPRAPELATDAAIPQQDEVSIAAGREAPDGLPLLERFCDSHYCSLPSLCCLRPKKYAAWRQDLGAGDGGRR